MLVKTDIYICVSRAPFLCEQLNNNLLLKLRSANKRSAVNNARLCLRIFFVNKFRPIQM